MAKIINYVPIIRGQERRCQVFVESCGIEECAYNRDGRCGKESISINRKTFSSFRSGEREWSAACDDYKEMADDEAD